VNTGLVANDIDSGRLGPPGYFDRRGCTWSSVSRRSQDRVQRCRLNHRTCATRRGGGRRFLLDRRFAGATAEQSERTERGTRPGYDSIRHRAASSCRRGVAVNPFETQFRFSGTASEEISNLRIGTGACRDSRDRSRETRHNRRPSTPIQVWIRRAFWHWYERGYCQSGPRAQRSASTYQARVTSKPS
jgi:hypothetical protein